MNTDHVTGLLQELVRIPSVTPVGNPGTTRTGEAELAGFVANFLRKLSLDVEVQEVRPGRPNVIGHFASRGGKRRVALAPHTDTVSVTGMTIDPFGGEVRDGKLFGRGACDTKGSVAAMLGALARCVRAGEFRAGDLDVDFCAVMGEETGSDGARALCARGYRADFAIAGEPTNCRAVHAHKGSLWFKVITRGKSCHASTPELGKNAVVKMAAVIPGLLDRSRWPAPDPVLGAPTINVGVIRGGSATNIVPDRCEVEVDRRLIPGEQADRVLADIRDRLGVEIEAVRECPPLFTPADHPFIRALDVPVCGAPWFCDAAVFAEHGIPAIAFGPGDIAQAHTADEFLELAELHRATEILERFLKSGGPATTPG